MTDTAESTVVGESILIAGNIHGDEDLTILGRVEGSISLSKTLIVAESGVIKAEISVRNAVVSGVVVGNITATDSVQITETGRLVGDLKAPRIIITAGARVRGTIDMGDLESPRGSAPLPARSTTALTTARPSQTLPPRRAMPAMSRTTPPARPAAPAVAKATAPAPTPGRVSAGPMAAKKIKKKVVVKKKG